MCLPAADVVALVLDSLHAELMSVESRGLFIHYRGVCALLLVLRTGRGGLHIPVDILMQLTEHSRKYVSHVSQMIMVRSHRHYTIIKSSHQFNIKRWFESIN